MNYICEALNSGIPVFVGVEYGEKSYNNDETTNHFIVIVGMGCDDYGYYFHFYDNASSYRKRGTDKNINRLYINVDEMTATTKDKNTILEKVYRLSQIRRSVPLDKTEHYNKTKQDEHQLQ